MYGTSPSHPYEPALVPPAHLSGSDYALAGPTTASSSTGPYRQPLDSPFPPSSAVHTPPASFEPTTAMAFAHASHFVRLHSYVPSGISPEVRLQSQQRDRLPRPDQLPTPPSSDAVPIELSVYCTLYVAALQDPSLPPGAKSIRLCFGEHPVATRVARGPPPPSSEVDPNEPPGASQDLFLTCNIPTNSELLAAGSNLLRKGLHPEEIARIPLYCEILGGAMGTAEESVLERVWFGEFDFGGGGGIGAVKFDDRMRLSVGGWSDGRQSSGALVSYGHPSPHGAPPSTMPTTSLRPPPSPVTSGVARGERRRPGADHHPYGGRTSKKVASPSFYSTSGSEPPSQFMVSIDPSALQAGRGAGPGSYSYSPEPSAQYEYPDLSYQHLPNHSGPSSSSTSLATPCSPPPTYHSPSAPGPSPTTSMFTRTSSLPQGSPSMPDEPAPVPSPIERNSPAKSEYGYGVKAQGATRASLQLDGDLFSMAVGWTHEEWTARRRLVRFWRTMEGPVIRASFQAIAPTEYHEDSIIVSCIFREETNECYVTSVDAIYLLEALVGSRFSIEEKNRVRRNLEQCKPDTVSKTKAETEVFFKLIMSFERPRPRNIEKDVKVFKWREFGPALVKSIAKYTVSADLTAAK